MLDGVTEHVTDGVCDRVCDGVWLFGKDGFKECPLTTMVIATTMANNGIRFGDIRSMFLSSRYAAVSEQYKSSRSRLFLEIFRVCLQVPVTELSWSRTSHQGVGCFTDDVVGHMGCCMDGMCLELWGGDIPSVKTAEMSVPLQQPHAQ